MPPEEPSSFGKFTRFVAVVGKDKRVKEEQKDGRVEEGVLARHGMAGRQVVAKKTCSK